MSYKNSVKSPGSPGVLVAQWIECPPGVREVMGSNPIGTQLVLHYIIFEDNTDLHIRIIGFVLRRQSHVVEKALCVGIHTSMKILNNGHA